MDTDIKLTEPKLRDSASEKVAGFFRALIGLPLAAFGGIATLVFLFSVLAYVADRIGGHPPQPSFLSIFMVWVFFGGVPLGIGSLLLKMRTGAPRFFKAFGGVLLALVLVAGIDSQCGPKNWHALFRRERVAQGNAASFKKTLITPHLETEIRNGTSLLWCGTFQLAWNEACKAAGGNLQLAAPGEPSLAQHPMAEVLNKQEFAKDCVDEASYVAMAGVVKDKMDEKILAAVKDKFHGGFQPRLLPEKYTSGRPQDLVAYACLWKKLSFAVPFEALEDSFAFDGVKVRAFGIGKTKASHEGMYSQVQILDYQDEKDFVVQLRTTPEGDRLILAKMRPNGTLKDTIAVVRERVAWNHGETAGTNDVLIVPRVSFDLLREYTELEHRWLVLSSGKVAPDLELLSALQSIKFEMNEKGVELISEAHLAFGCGMETPPPRKHIMILDRPFLVLLERTGARMPYFAFWVDNPELLVPW